MRRECREGFPRHRIQRKTLVNGPGMHHGTFPAFPAHAQATSLRIWQEAHEIMWLVQYYSSPPKQNMDNV